MCSLSDQKAIKSKASLGRNSSAGHFEGEGFTGIRTGSGLRYYDSLAYLGGVTTTTYPSGRAVKNTFAGNGDLSLVETMPLGGSYSTRASNFVFSAHGAVKGMRSGKNRNIEGLTLF